MCSLQVKRVGNECVCLTVYGHCSGWFMVWQYDVLCDRCVAKTL